jgi:type II secretory pathway pseudopilin PulG
MKFALPIRRRSSECGYILLSLMLLVALMAIAAAAIAPTLAFQVKRDREEELIHRGVQYSRAVRRYFKKFGRYPTRVEDLENSNNLRFLRRRYKDPITNKDFKLLHFGEVRMMMGAGIMGATAAGTPIGNGPAGTSQNAGGFSLSANSNNNAQGGQVINTSQGNKGKDSAADANADTGRDDDKSDDKNADAQNGSKMSGSSGQTFGGGPIVGVVSPSKLESIREFNNKNHYNQWQFIYDPSTDRGGLLNTPAQPPLQNAVAPQPGANGTGATGQPAGFGAQAPGIGGTPLNPQTPEPMHNQPQQPTQPQQQ